MHKSTLIVNSCALSSAFFTIRVDSATVQGTYKRNAGRPAVRGLGGQHTRSVMALYQRANPLNMVGISVFDVLREELNVGDLVEHDGCGKECRCPSANHEDKNPSAHIYDDGRVHCFGCGWHGDVVDVWAERKGFDNLLEAALDLAREYSVRLPETNPEARARAQEARMKEEKYSTIAGSCHKALNAESGARVREWYESRGFGEELQRHLLLGANRDGDTAIIPFWRKGRIV